MPARALPVNLRALCPALALAACVSPAPRGAALHGLAPPPPEARVTTSLDTSLRARPDLFPHPGLAFPPPPGGGDSLQTRVMAEATGAKTVRQATVDEDLGDALTQRLREFSTADLNQWGLGLLTPEELFGDGTTPGLCEAPELRFDFDEGGADYEAALAVYTYSALLGDPVAMDVSISDTCVASLTEHGGDLAAAEQAGGCAEDEVHTFFEEGSGCRACVEGNGGDYAACEADGACLDEVPLAVSITDPEGLTTWYRGVYATAWGCAPDYPAQFYFMVDMGEDGVLPRSFDHDAWAFVCTPLFDEATGQPDVVCMGSNDPVERGTLGEGLFGYVSYIRPKGSDTLGWRGRQYYVDEVQVSATPISWFFASNPGLGAISAPRVIADTDGDGQVGPGDEDWGFGSGGFGLDPHQTRPDGELNARDWLAVATMKTATTIDGVPIYVYQRNRCARWEGGPDGASRCADVTAPEGDWLNDLYVAWSNTEHTRVVQYPLTTLASTGMIDPDVPGGVVTHIAGTPGLATEGWDACTLPHTIEPDLASMEDHPLDWGGSAALDAWTWRFDRTDVPDIRMALATNRARGWCGGDAGGGGRSVLDEL